MYAIIRTGGKQYKVQAGDLVRVEKLEKELGSEFDLTEVLAVGGTDKPVVGQPIVPNAKVTVVVTNQSKLPKVIVFKKKRRQGYRRMKGHRQMFTELFIKEIVTPGGTVKAESAAPVFDPKKREERLQKQMEARKAAKQPGVSKAEKRKAKTTKKAAAKKVAKKAAVKKTAGKKKAKKKAAGKKAAKKATKKTAK